MSVVLTLNGVVTTLDTPPDALLLDALRAHGLMSVKDGCREGSCGACVVLIDGRAVPACVTLAGQAHGRRVETVEGLGDADHPHPLQARLAEAGAVQCGYCTPGLIMAAKGLLDANPAPTHDEIARALDGNLCRCTGYVKIVEGVARAAEDMRTTR